MERHHTARPSKMHSAQLSSVEQLLEHFSQIEAQLQEVRDGLTHSHRLATLGTIASIVAHEYNNILTPIISYAQISLARPDDREFMTKALEKCLAGAERAAKISSSLLGFAREADESQHVAHLPRVVEDALTCLAREPKKDGIQLTIDVPDVHLAIAPINLEQVLVNLILNARSVLAGSGGQLRITSRVEAGLVHIDVADTGPGIPQAIRERLFEPFVTLRPAAENGERKGTGLGLSICRDLIRGAGGNIRFTTATGKGTTFHITLPKADDVLAA